MSSTRCTPWLGVTILRCVGLSMCMMSSTKHPAAFTTLRALIVCSSPVRLSTNFTPAARPASSCTIPVTLAWFTTVPPFSMHVCARLIAMRESSNCPSWYTTPPLSPFSTEVGMYFITFFAEMNFERP